ncbi:MAG: gliding motility-associated C-terminal domain-containing protein [Saprospiraceae bacterium]|nr:gliding motility-associated C-terminal domain-containing protein [Saprospiraceae bacterium]
MRDLFLFLSLLIPSLLFAQPPFQKVYDNGQASSQALAATSTPDGGSAFVGIIEIVGAASEVMVTKLSCSGDVEWVKTLGQSSTVDNVFPEIRSDASGRIWFASNVGVYQNYDGILGVLSPDGDLLKAVRIGKPGRNDQLFGLALDTLGHIYVTGATNSWGSDKSGNTAYTDVFVACLDTNLNMLWARTLGNPQNIDTGFSLELDQQNRPLITGRYIVNGTFFGFCLRMTPAGDVDLFKGFGESVVPHRTYGYGINSTSDGHILLTGSTTLNKENHQSLADVYLIKMDEDGEPLFSNIYIPTVGSDNSESGSSVVESEDGRYAIGVPTMSFSAFSQGFVPNKNAVFVTESNGALSEAKLYNTGGSHYTKLQERPGGFLLSNFSTNYGGPSFFKPLIIATDDKLVSGCNEINVTSQVQLVNEGWEFSDITYNTDTSYAIQPYTVASDYAYQLVQVLCETPEDVSGMWDVPDTLCLGELLVATGSGNSEVTSQIWDLGDGTIIKDVEALTYQYQQMGTYQVSMRLNWACSSLDFTQPVVIEDCNCEIVFPNVFTPNGDQTNDLFGPYVACNLQVLDYSLNVYNRYGKLVFESPWFGSGWDGTFKSEDQAMDVYAWVCTMRYLLDGQEVSWTRRGDISLIR